VVGKLAILYAFDLPSTILALVNKTVRQLEFSGGTLDATASRGVQNCIDALQLVVPTDIRLVKVSQVAHNDLMAPEAVAGFLFGTRNLVFQPGLQMSRR
jgi:hypothetical protein